ncbi:hypothetical protein AB6G19_07760 [Providencia manganoxydans]
MTNIQLLLLATNNFKEDIALSHTQGSYIYQFYYAQIALQHLSIDSFLSNYKVQIDPILKNNHELYAQREQIYQLIKSYLEQAETRFIERKKFSTKTNK